MKAVSGLLEHNRSRRLKYFFSHLHTAREFRVSLDNRFSDLCLRVMVGRQTVHKFHVRIAGSFHQFFIDLIGQKRFDTFIPNFLWFSHRDPNIRMDEVHPFYRCFGIFSNCDPCARSLGEFSAHVNQFLRGPISLWCSDTNIHAHFCADK